jgi:hypothetical protein
MVDPEDFEQLTDDLEKLAEWKEDLSFRLHRADICFNSSVGVLEEHIERLTREVEAWKGVANSLVKRMKDA